jgi:hypothetical protein
VHINQLAATEVAGALRISEAAINDLLNTPQSPIRGATLSVAPDNDVVLSYGVLRARVTLPRVIDVGAAPRVRLLLASFLLGLAVGAVLRQPYIRINGRKVTIFLAEIPALSGLRNVWPHVTSAGLRTDGRAIVMDFTFSVRE